MKNRQIKKNSKTAMHLLMQISPRRFSQNTFAQDFDRNSGVKGLWEYWYECGGECVEWDCEPAFATLFSLVFSENSVGDVVVVDGDPSWVWEFVPDLNTTKQVFDLAKEMIERGAA